MRHASRSIGLITGDKLMKFLRSLRSQFSNSDRDHRDMSNKAMGGNYSKPVQQPKTLKGLVFDTIAFMADVPRGDSTRYLKQQRAPQSRWMPIEDILRSNKLIYNPLNPGRKILIGAIGNTLIGIEDERHLMTCAGSRSGKSVGIINNALFYQGSMIFTDPKGEIAIATAERRAKVLGQDVKIIDPFRQMPPHLHRYCVSYNPMSILDIRAESFLDDISVIAQAIIIKAKEEKDPHWNESAGNFLEGVIAHVATYKAHAHRANLITVRSLITKSNVKAKKNEDDKKEKPKSILYMEMLSNAAILQKNPETEDIGNFIYSSAIDYFSKQGSEAASVFATLTRHTKWLDLRSFRQTLCHNDIDLRELKTSKNGLSIYLCFPGTRIEHSKRWMRIFINQFLDTMERIKTKPELPVLACLDEFPVLGYMPQLEMAAALIAGFGVKLWIVIQNWSQGKSAYGEGWETFAANVCLLQFFSNIDPTTTEMISKMLGKTLIEDKRLSEVSQEQIEKGISGKTEHVQIIDMLLPSEVPILFSRDDPFKRQLIIWAGYLPMIIQRVAYYDPQSPLHDYLNQVAICAEVKTRNTAKPQ